MSDILSSITELPRSCKSAAERTAAFLQAEDRYADLSESNRKKLTKLEQELSRDIGEDIALVAYRLS